MKYWLILIDSLDSILFDSIANKEIVYSCSGCSQIRNGDRILGYITSPIGELRMLFSATEDAGEDFVCLAKQIDSSVGCTVEQTLYERIAALSSTDNRCMELSQEEFTSAVESIFDRIREHQRSLLPNSGELFKESEKVKIDDVPDLTIEELADILKDMYNNAKESGQVAAIHMFGFKYGDIIINNGYSQKTIISLAGINDSYSAELNKGVNIYRSVKANEYGVRFDGESINDDDMLSHNVYGIHITGKSNALSANDPHICIGWSKMGDMSGCKDKDSISAKHAETWPDAKVKSRGQDVGQIYRFVVESQIGDYVVFGDGATAHIGVIKSDYYYQENPQDQDSDYVNNKSVEWLKDVPYAELSAQFKNSLGSAMSFFRLNDYKSVIADLLNDTYEKDDDVDITAYDYKQVSGKGENLVIYGTPGCGKSYYVMHDLLMEDQQEKAGVFKKDHIFRTTFYQDYTNTDFVGQVMPVVQYQKDGSGAEESIVTYKFVPGPFTLALECAIANPTEKVALVIEELNRGNAASIFGDLFQLLDRVDEGEKSDFPLCTSEYGILNVNIVAYLKDCEHYDKKYKYSFDLDEIRIPANLYIYATMNTSDQNVYTLDTAFKRRWGFEKLKNIFKSNHDYADYLVPGMSGITWKQLVTDINMFIVSDSNMLASEDKQIGVYFIGKNLLLTPNTEPSAEEVKKKQEKFAYKLFEYLWDDVAKFSHDRWFGKIKTLDELIEKFMNGEKVFADGIINQKD